MNDERDMPAPNPRESLPEESGSPSRNEKPEGGSGGNYRIRRWLFVLVGAVLFALLLREVLYPFAGKPYLEITHGSHVHYVPRDRNETVPVSAFPMRPPGPDERITPDGDLVSAE